MTLSIATTSLSQGGLLDAGLLLGLMLLAAIVGGSAARIFHLPRVVGYLVAGVGLRFVLVFALSRSRAEVDAQNLLTSLAGQLQVIKTVALGLIMFVIGNVFEVRHVKAIGARVLRISLCEAVCVIGLVGVGCSLVLVFSEKAFGEAVSVGMMLGVIALATAPAATLLVLREYDAKGPVSDTILTMTAINNTLSIVLFHSLFLVLAASGVIATGAGGDRMLWLDLLLTSVGSVALGAILGFLFSVLYSKVTLAEFLLVFFAVMIGLGAGDKVLAVTLHLSFNFLLTCLFLGAVFANITLDSGPLYDGLKTMSAPIFAAFFVFAGYELHLEELTHLGWLGAAYVGFRVLGKYIGVRLGTRWADWSGENHSLIGMGLLCQAGVAIGLADFLGDTWTIEQDGMLITHPLARQMQTVVLGSVVVFELIGPVALKSVAKRAGEVKAVTLLRRRRATPAEGDSITRLTVDAFLRTFGFTKRKTNAGGEDLLTRHIMRSNIKFIPAGANLDEVLHFVEGSRFNNFPVVDELGDFVGMIHFSDLRDMMYDPYMKELVTAVDLACPDDMVPADMPLDQLLERFNASDLPSFVVVESSESRRVVGLVEQRDLLQVLHAETKS